MITSIILPVLVVQFLSEDCTAEIVSSPRVRNKRDLEAVDIFGTSRKDMFDSLFDNHNIAMQSAQSAVTSSIGQVYGNQQAALAHTVKQFMFPLQKQKMIHSIANLPSSFISAGSSDSPWSNSDAVKIEKFTPQESKPSTTVKAKSKSSVKSEDSKKEKEEEV